MRILHIADLHLGQTLNGWGREREHSVWLDAVVDTLVSEEIDVLLIAGDVFDGINPSGESQRLLYRFLRNANTRRPTLKIIITSGNHDPSGRLEAPSDLFEVLDIHVFATLRRDGDTLRPDAHFVALHEPDGTLAAHVCAIPFLRASDLPGLSFSSEKGAGSPVVTAARRLHEAFGMHAEAICDGKPVLAMGHLHCRGAKEDTGETADRGIIIGGEHALPADVYPPIFSYVALGHIHRAQTLDEGRIRYCGSPFPLSASETGYRHGVTVIDINGTEITHKHLEVPRPVQFFRFPDQGAIRFEDFEARLENIDPDEYDDPEMYPFIYVNLEATGPAAVLLQDAERLIAQAPVRLAGLRVTRIREEAEEQAIELKSLDETTPEDLFLPAFLKANKIEAEERHIIAFREALTGND